MDDEKDDKNKVVVASINVVQTCNNSIVFYGIQEIKFGRGQKVEIDG